MASKRKRQSVDSINLCRKHSLDDKTIQHIRHRLRKWYRSNARDLPWRHTQHYNQNDIAYRVLVSEIMLQQTQVKTVIEYYNRWMERWPTLDSLADETDVQEVLAVWSGLGYYNRAKRLHQTAQIVKKNYGGTFPSDYETLVKTLPGIGAYTAGAIRSIAFNQPTPAVDGNILRVFSRLCGLSIPMFGNKSHLTNIATRICQLTIDADQPGHFNQCVMDIGATICLPKGEPKCGDCPLSDICHTYNNLDGLIADDENENESERVVDGCYACENKAECSTLLHYDFVNFPGSTKSKPSPITHYIVIALELCDQQQNQRYWLMSQRPSKGLLASLWEFLVIDGSVFNCTQTEHHVCDYDITEFINQKLSGLNQCKTESLIDVVYKTTLKHIFSHRVHMYRLFHAKINQFDCGDQLVNLLNSDLTLFENTSQQFKRVHFNNLNSVPVSTSVKKMLKFLN